MSRFGKSIGFYLLLFVLIWGIWAVFGIQSSQENKIYSDLVQYLEQGQVTQMVLS